MRSKECTKCHETLKLNQFPRQVFAKDGHMKMCALCFGQTIAQGHKKKPSEGGKTRYPKGKKPCKVCGQPTNRHPRADYCDKHGSSAERAKFNTGKRAPETRIALANSALALANHGIGDVANVACKALAEVFRRFKATGVEVTSAVIVDGHLKVTYACTEEVPL
jgi:hypothetical protein